MPEVGRRSDDEGEVAESGNTLLIYAPSARTGGTLRYLREAVPRLVAVWPGRSVIVVPATSADLVRDVVPGVEVLIVPEQSGGWLAQMLRNQIYASSLERDLSPAVTFCLGNTAYLGPRVRAVTLAQNAASPRDLRHGSPRYYLYLAAIRALLALAQLRSHSVIAVSSHMARRLPLSMRRSRATVVHHGTAWRPVHSEVTRNMDNLLLPGAVYPYKGIELALEALSKTSRRLTLDIAGEIADPRYFRFCQQLAEQLGVDGRVRWMGRLTEDELRDEMMRAGAILLSSRAEACPNVLLEAAAAHPLRPIVGLRTAWSAEFDHLFDSRCDVADLPAALDALCGTTSLPEIVVGRQRSIDDDFNWSVSIGRTLEVLSAAVRG